MSVISDIDEPLGHICDACGSGLPTQGWHVPYQSMGYYNGFTDNLNSLLSDEQEKYWFMCHDCIVKLLALFPRLGEFLDKGEHPCRQEVPCCRWAWRMSDDHRVQIVDDEGNWVTAELRPDDFGNPNPA